jgi:hypothetical protein
MFEEVPPIPTLSRTTSNNVSNQLTEPTCYAHVAARILLRYFKVYIINPMNLPGNNESTTSTTNSPCDDLYLNPLRFCNSATPDVCRSKWDNLLEKCGGNQYEHVCLILYMFFYTLIVEKKDYPKRKVSGEFLTATLNYAIFIIYNNEQIDRITRHCKMHPSDCDIIQGLLRVNYGLKDMLIESAIIDFGTSMVVVDLCNYFIRNNLYAGITIDGVILKRKTPNFQFLRIL